MIPRHVTDAASAAAVISANVEHAIDLTGHFTAAPDTRLVVFPEFFLQGSRMGRMPQIFPIAGINLKSSPHIDRLARFTRAGVFVAPGGAAVAADSLASGGL